MRVAAGAVLVPIKDRSVVYVALVDRRSPFPHFIESMFIFPVDVPGQFLIETDWHVVMKTEYGKERRVCFLGHIGHARTQPFKNTAESPAKCERIFRTEVIDSPFFAIDTDFVIAFHNGHEPGRGCPVPFGNFSIVGSYTELPANDV